MKHLKENELIACTLGFGEAGGLEHLAACGACQARAAQLRTLLDAAAVEEPPAPPTDLAAHVLQALPEEPAEYPRPTLSWLNPARAALLAGAGVALAMALFLARPSGPRTAPANAPSNDSASSQRLLYLATAAHLDRTQALLVELEHAPASSRGPVDLAPERAAAQQLLASNRLYQQGARAERAPVVAGVLDTLEPVLIEIEHAPDQASRQEWQAMEGSIARNAILFKVRVLQQSLRAQALSPKEDGSL